LILEDFEYCVCNGLLDGFVAIIARCFVVDILDAREIKL
jgi:hypothetical protein